MSGWRECIRVVKFAGTGQTPVWARCFGGSWDDRASAIAVGPDGIYVAGSTSSPDFPAGSNGVLKARSLDGFVSKLSMDGAMIWSRLIGGSSDERINSLCLSNSGDVYIGGETESFDLPVVRALVPHLIGVQNGMLGRLDASGYPKYLTDIGGTGHDRIIGIRCDIAGNAYAAGSTDSVDFPTTVNALMRTRPGPNSGFVLKLMPQGDNLGYSTYLGGSRGISPGSEEPSGIALGPNGTVYIVGVTSSPDFPVVSAYQKAFKGWDTDGYLAHCPTADHACCSVRFWAGPSPIGLLPYR